ncbi:MAG: alpha/beta fold hydrolase [Candidatus Binatia bacterium]
MLERPARRALLRFLNGIEWLIRDPQRVVGQTPFELVYQSGKLSVRRYRHRDPTVRPRRDLPVLCVPPLMVKPFIFDLFPGRSLVQFLIERAFDVYLVDFGEPDAADAYVTLDDYVLDWLPTACGAVREATHARELSLVGYCMGGLFALMYLAVTGDRAVRNLITIGAPIDVSKMGTLAWVAQIAGARVESLAQRVGNVPGGLSSTVFRLLTPAKNLTRYTDLFMNMWDREYMNGFDAMNQWVSQFTDYPQAAFQQFVRDFLRHNELVRGQMRFGGRRADLRRVRANLLAFAGRTDRIAPPDAVRAQLDAIGGEASFRLVPGGHMGILAGRAAPPLVWQPMARWLSPRSDARPTAARASTAPLRARARRGAAHGRRDAGD